MNATIDGPRPLDTETRAGLLAIYADLDADVAALGPTCELSGRCCRFEAYGHTLFLSTPEAALLVADAPPPVAPLDDGSTCPWQDRGGRCTAREARPIGCRVYFCDPTFQEALPGLSERYIGRLKTLVTRLGLAWGYAPLHWHLRDAGAAGLIAFPAPPGDAEPITID